MSLKLLSVKPLLWVIGGLAIALVAQGIVLRGQVALAEAARDTAQARVSTLTTSRDAFQLRTEELATANAEWGETVDVLQAELGRAQRDLHILDKQSRDAIARARAEARDADATLKKFVDQFATESTRPDCARALADLEAKCPALSDY